MSDKKYKALFLDVDGTLVHKFMISEENRRAILKALKKGVKVTIASGRGDFMVLPMAHDLYLDCFGDSYSIALNGTELIKNQNCALPKDFEENVDAYMTGDIRDYPRNPMPEELKGYRCLAHEMIPDEVTAYLVELGNRNKVYFHIYEGSKVYFMVPENPRYTKFTKYDSQVECLVLGEPDLKEREEYFSKKEWTDDITATADKVYENYKIPTGAQKVIFLHPDHELLEQCAKEASVFSEEIRAEFFDWHSLEFTPVTAGKGIGLRKVADALGIAVEDTVAMGDGENDLTMLAAAGLSVVPANALDSVKKKADVVLEKTCAESAVAEAIERFFL